MKRYYTRINYLEPKFQSGWGFWFPVFKKHIHSEHSEITCCLLCFCVTCWWSTIKQSRK